ncbi:MAG: peptidoglycan-binding protein [Bryobacteraceae bacterium]|jgi:hypothetical protein
MPYHDVKQGETLASIADLYGFFWETLWNDPLNAVLRDTRKDPNVLMARDRVFVPEKRSKQESGATGQVHTFQLQGVPVRLNFRLLDEAQQPRSGQRFRLWVDGKQVASATTPDDGLISAVISPRAKSAKLVVSGPDGDETYEFSIGHLNPVSYTSGVQARLKNLGYYPAEISGNLDDATRQALRRFQVSEGLEETGEPDSATLGRLLEQHES